MKRSERMASLAYRETGKGCIALALTIIAGGWTPRVWMSFQVAGVTLGLGCFIALLITLIAFAEAHRLRRLARRESIYERSREVRF